MIAILVAKSEPKNVDICQILNFKIDFFWQRDRGYYMPARGYEFYLRVVNSISHE